MRPGLRRGLALGGVLLVLALAGCSQKVTAKSCSGGKCTITYSQYKDGGEKIKDRTLAVTRETFERCSVGDKWPDCDRSQPRSGMRNVPVDKDGKASADREPPINDPYESRKRNRKDRDPKLVCVQSIALERMDVTNTWTIGDEHTRDVIRNQGEYQRCRNAQPGDVASLTAEHHATPGMIQCTIWIAKNGNKQIIDYAHVQEMADCKVKAVVK